MNILEFLREQAKGYDCHVCGSNHSRSEIRVLGRLESSWVVRITCASCHHAFKLLVVADESRAAAVRVKEDHPSERRRPAVTADEVLDTHDFLRAYDGGVSGLLPETEKSADRSR